MNSLKKNKLIELLIFLIVLIFIINFFGIYISNYYFDDGDYRDSFGFLFKPDDRPPVSLNSSIGNHYFGDISELSYLSKLDDPYNNEIYEQSYPPLLIFLFKNMVKTGQDVLIVNIAIHILSLILIYFASLQYSNNSTLTNSFFLFFVLCSKFFFYSIDRGNIEFLVIGILFFSVFYKLSTTKRIGLLALAVSLKPSVLIFIPIFGFNTLLLTVVIAAILYIVSFALLKEPIFESSLNMIEAFSKTQFPTLHNWQLLDQDLSIWGKLYWARHTDSIVNTSLGNFLQGIYNNRAAIFYLLLFFIWTLYFLKQLEPGIHFWILIGITSCLFFSFSGVYKSAILIIPLFYLFTSSQKVENENSYIVLITFIFLQLPFFRHMNNFDIYNDITVWSFFSFVVSLILFCISIKNIIFSKEKNE